MWRTCIMRATNSVRVGGDSRFEGGINRTFMAVSAGGHRSAESRVGEGGVMGVLCRTLSVIGAVTWLSGCAVGPDYELPIFAVPAVVWIVR